MGVSVTGLGSALERIGQMARGMTKARDDSMRKGANYLLTEIKERFLLNSMRQGDGTWPEHSPWTISRRGKKAPILHETGQLYRSIVLRKIPDGLFIGVPSNARGHKGQTFMIASVHENGALIEKDDKVFRIPARPFIKPIVEDREHIKRALEIVEATFAKKVGLNRKVG